MSAETQAEFDAKKKFIEENMMEVVMGKEVPGYNEAIAWCKATKVAHINKEASAIKLKAMKKWLKEQTVAGWPSLNEAQDEAYNKECDRQKGFW